MQYINLYRQTKSSCDKVWWIIKLYVFGVCKVSVNFNEISYYKVDCKKWKFCISYQMDFMTDIPCYQEFMRNKIQPL